MKKKKLFGRILLFLNSILFLLVGILIVSKKIVFVANDSFLAVGWSVFFGVLVIIFALTGIVFGLYSMVVK